MFEKGDIMETIRNVDVNRLHDFKNHPWLTQKMMATLYDVGLPTINEHIKKIYADSELEESATIRNFRIVQTEGSRQVTRDTKHYNLQMIIAIAVFCAVRYQDEAFDLNDLELCDVIETIAEDLYTATQKVVPKPGQNKV